ncbi:MAG TPA: NAD(P)/FAD-dependent oxidoreductase [Candidatus Binatia bacterium]|nr:NAD(P)/FAD-dependent oxidoreductase [Candidatus Binatia bacterium]
MQDAVVVGAGPNGLAAAITLAQRGWGVHVVEAAERVGGGCRTAELTLPGFRHDICSTVDAFGTLSPFLTGLDLGALGVEWVHPPAPLAHAFSDRPATIVERDISATAAGLGPDYHRYAGILGPLVHGHRAFADTVLGPLVRVPRHPLFMAGFGRYAALPATLLSRLFAAQGTRALIGGAAAHSIAPLSQPLTGAAALIMLGTAHGSGWPVVRGGSQVLADALAARLGELGGTIETGRTVRRMSDLPDARAYLFDLSPWQLAAICADDLPTGYLRRLRRYRRGPGVFKLDYALSGPIPWRDPACLRAGTVHVGGLFEDVARSEAAVAAGRVSERPFLLVVQASLFDPTRAPEGRHTAWVYCHVPNGFDLDISERIERRLEEHAPGFRDLVLERRAMNAAQMEAHNPNCAGGDIAGGRNTVRQIVLRPVPSLNPYATPNPRIFICSASTPPGGGVHGMCGYHAAHAVLRRRP